MSIKIKELPSAERPYEKLELYGEQALSNAELLAIIIKSGTKDETSVELAQKILKLSENSKENNLSFLNNVCIEELMQIKGIGKVKAIQIKAVCELAVRMFKPANYKKIKIKSPQDVANVLMNELKNEKKEIIKLVILNNKNVIIKIKNIAIGGSNFANFSMSEVLGEAIKAKAPKIILVHNHPSGDSTPSQKDIEVTYSLYDAANIVGIELLDHLVIGDMQYTSIFGEIAKKVK